MSPPKERDQSTDPRVLASNISDLDRRVTRLEERVEKREDSQGGFRKEIGKELTEHKIDTLEKVQEVKDLIGNLKDRIGALENKITDAASGLRWAKWMLGIIILLGLAANIISIARK